MRLLEHSFNNRGCIPSGPEDEDFNDAKTLSTSNSEKCKVSRVCSVETSELLWAVVEVHSQNTLWKALLRTSATLDG